jgi:hypothetical protein
MSALIGSPEDPRPASVLASPKATAPDAPNSRPTDGVPTPKSVASGGPTSPAATAPATPKRQPPQGTTTTGGLVSRDPHVLPAAGSSVPDPVAVDRSTTGVPALLDPALSLAADILDDLERVRMANNNRMRALLELGLPPEHPDVKPLAYLVSRLLCGRAAKGAGCCLEHDAEKELRRRLRKHPLGAWMKAQKGIGEKQGARLLAAIGDPYIRPELLNEDGSVKSKEGPRTVSALWAYCGLHVLPVGQPRCATQSKSAGGDQHGDPGQGSIDTLHPCAGVAAKRQRGVKSNWSSAAKMRAYLVAEKCMQTGRCQQCRDGQASDGPRVDDAVPACACSPYRVTYDARRAHAAVTHPEWTDGHSHNDALRVSAKAILRDLWRAARDHHGRGES